MPTKLKLFVFFALLISCIVKTVNAQEQNELNALKVLTSYEIIVAAKYVVQNEVGRYYVSDVLRGSVDRQLNEMIKKSIRIEKFAENGEVLFLVNKIGPSYLPMKTPIRKNEKLLFLRDGDTLMTDMKSLRQEIDSQDRPEN